jgi:2-C-methyl-D-erythritol 4-phosphate cytidylyltransferase / 2-C-methyl-D-erythritol 2,4-cyclodiphosphate synthase
MQHVWAILVAGGVGNRFGGKLPKQFRPLGSKRVIDYSIELFSSLKDFAGVVLVLPPEFIPEWKMALEKGPLKNIRIGPGGISRQKSVQNGLGLVDADAEWILVHDVARPLVSAELVRRTLAGALETGCAVTAIPVPDTLKKADESHFVEKTVSRDRLHMVQTPQVFSKKLLLEALHWAESKGLEATDEAGLVERMGHRVRLVEGSVFNFKITRSEDLQLAEAFLTGRKGSAVTSEMRIGEGYDVHPFAEGRKLILGGVEIPFEKGLQGHSDADALLHAICDACLGAMAEGDLGAHFPDSDPRYRGISSLVLLEKVNQLVQSKGFEVANIDATVICQRPKLAPHLLAMRENIARTVKVPVDRISVKATTEEGLGFTGTLQGLAAKAVVLVRSQI